MTKPPFELSLKSALIMIFVAGIAVFAHTLTYPFVYDDLWTIVHNDALQSVFPISRFFVDPQTAAMPLSGIGADVYRPLSTLSFAINRAIFGLHPATFRLWNLLIHITNASLLFLLLRKFFGNMNGLMGALVFLLHPAQVESVVWVTQRSNLLCGLGVLSMMLGWASFSTPKNVLLFWGGIFVALLSKETALMIPIVLLGMLILVHPFEWFKDRRRIQVLGLSALISLVFFGVRFVVLGRWGQNIRYSSSFFESVTEGLSAITIYTRTLLFPLWLNVSIEGPLIVSLKDPRTAGGLFLGFGLLTALMVSFRKSKGVFAGLLVVFAFWAPHSGVVPLVTYAAERFLYLPMIGLSFIVGHVSTSRYMGGRPSEPLSPRKWHGRTVLTLVFIVFCGIISVRRTFDWRSELALWSSSIKDNPHNAFAQACFAGQLEQQGQLDDAERAYELALKNQPTFELAEKVIARLVLLNRRQQDQSGLENWRQWQEKLEKDKDKDKESK